MHDALTRYTFKRDYVRAYIIPFSNFVKKLRFRGQHSAITKLINFLFSSVFISILKNSLLEVHGFMTYAPQIYFAIDAKISH